MNRKFVVFTVILATFCANAFAAAPTTLADLWGTVNLTDLIAAILGIGALVIGVDLTQLGYMKVRRIVKGAH